MLNTIVNEKYLIMIFWLEIIDASCIFHHITLYGIQSIISMTINDIFFFLGTSFQWQKKKSPDPYLIIGVFYLPHEHNSSQLELKFWCYTPLCVSTCFLVLLQNFSVIRDGSNNPNRIIICPPDNLLSDWRADYESMRNSFIYGESLPFDDLIERIRTLQERFRKL